MPIIFLKLVKGISKNLILSCTSKGITSENIIGKIHFICDVSLSHHINSMKNIISAPIPLSKNSSDFHK
jgi:hypothetical protein